jgi:hypothetical protein
MVDEFPDRATKENIETLIEKAEQIEKKANQTRYGLPAIIILAFITMLVVLGSLFLTIWLGFNGFLNFILTLPMAWQSRVFFLVMFVVAVSISLPILSLVALSIFWFQRRFLGYPNHEKLIFANCFIMAKYLTKGKRMEAKKEAPSLMNNLKSYTRDLFNPKRKMYAPEFDLLRSGKLEFCRMIMFSKEGVPELLEGFGLAFVRDEDPEAHVHLTKLVKTVCKYGEPKGRLHRLLLIMEQYPHSLAFVLAIIIFIISVLLTLFGNPLKSVT